MGRLLEISCLLLVAALAALLPASVFAQRDEAKVRQSRSLILEYNWPKMIKGLKRFPHVMSCQHFYATRIDGSHVIKKCPEGEIFDFPTLKCSKKASAKCWSDQFKAHHSKKVKKNFVCPFSWGLYPDIEDCSQFFNCLNGKPYHRKCPSPSLFDKAERKCVKKSDAMCADQSDVVEPGYKCPYTWGFFTYPKDCSKYYECLQKNPSLRSCKKDLLFDNQKRKCLPQNKVECCTRFNPYAVTSTKITSKDPRFTSTSYSKESSSFDSSSSEEDSSEEIGKRKSTTSSNTKFSTISFKTSSSDSDSSEEDSSEEIGKRKSTTRSNKKFSTISFKTSSSDSDSSEEDKVSTRNKWSTTDSKNKYTKLFTQSVTMSDSDSSEESTESRELTTESKSKSTKMFTGKTVTAESDGPGDESLTTASKSKFTKLFTDTIVTSESDGPEDDTESTGNELLTTAAESKSTKLFTDTIVTAESNSTKLFTHTIVTAKSEGPGNDTESTGNEPLTTAAERKSTKLFTDTIVTAESESPGDDTGSTGYEGWLTKVESNSI